MIDNKSKIWYAPWIFVLAGVVVRNLLIASSLRLRWLKSDGWKRPWWCLLCEHVSTRRPSRKFKQCGDVAFWTKKVSLSGGNTSKISITSDKHWVTYFLVSVISVIQNMLTRTYVAYYVVPVRVPGTSTCTQRARSAAAAEEQQQDARPGRPSQDTVLRSNYYQVYYLARSSAKNISCFDAVSSNFRNLGIPTCSLR